MRCIQCQSTFGKIPNTNGNINYSDHEGVCAEFLIDSRNGLNNLAIFNLLFFNQIKKILIFLLLIK